MRKTWFLPVMIAAFAGMIVLSACSMSLAEDITPPPNYVPPQEVTSAVQQTVLPFVAPDPMQGASIFLEKCAPCHGDTGQGDGPQAARLASPPPAIGSTAISRAARPSDWYALVTNGNLAKFMPGFSGSLSDRQRWDVVAYALNLSMSSQDLSLGMQVYQEQCQTCHGRGGRGDGPQAASLAVKSPDWSEPSSLLEKSNQDLFDITSTGAGADAPMPGFADKLSTEQRWAAVDFIRTLTFASPGTLPAAAQAPQVTAAPGADQTALPTPSPDLTGVSGTLTTTPAAPAAEVTSDISGLTADRLHVIFEFPRPGVMQVAVVVIITNSENKMIVPTSAGSPVLTFTLPGGATNLQFQDGDLGARFIKTEQGFGDTQPISPSASFQEIFAYELPYDNNETIRLTVPIPAKQMVVMMTNAAVKVQSPLLQASGAREVQGTTLQLYVGADLQANTPLEVTLSGKPAAAETPGSSTAKTELIAAIVVFILALAAAAYWLYRQRFHAGQPLFGQKHADSAEEDEGDPAQDREELLLDSIVALDDLYQEGKLSKAAYQSRRIELLNRLKKL